MKIRETQNLKMKAAQKMPNLSTKISVIIASVLCIGLMGCERTVIVYKPNANLDPLPETKVEAVKAAKDPLFEKQWNLKKMGVDEKVLSSSKLLGSYNVKIAILSTGIDYNHEDLIGQVAVNKAEITQDGIGDRVGGNRKDDDGNGMVDDIVGWDVVDGDGLAYDRHGAGTAVAGIIGAVSNNGKGIAGLMKNVSLYPIRYINNNGQSNIALLVAAIEIAAKVNPDVVYIQNTQLQVGGHAGNAGIAQAEVGVLKAALKRLHSLKIPVVIGAGDGMDTFGDKLLEKALASFDNIVVVTATDKDDALPLLSNQSEQMVLTAAPGEDILTTKPKNTYANVSGTAYAAAQVTAAFGLAKALKGDKLGIKDVVSVLLSKEGSDKLKSQMRVSRGSNRLNVAKFVEELSKR